MSTRSVTPPRSYASNVTPARRRGYEPLTKLARARIEERMNDGSLTWPWIVEVEQDLDNAPRYVDGMRDLLQKSGLKGWQKDFDALTRELKAHDDWVRTTVLPRARKTNRLPPEIYADNLKAYGVDADPRDLMQRAMFAYLQTRDELDALARVYAAQKGLKSSNYRDVIRELKKNRVTGDQVLPIYKSHLAQLEDTLRQQNIVTLPKRDAVIRLSSEAESAASPAPHIDPPRLIGNTGEPAEFVLPLKNSQGEMDDFDSGSSPGPSPPMNAGPATSCSSRACSNAGSPPRASHMRSIPRISKAGRCMRKR